MTDSHLNENVGFERPTRSYHKNSNLCGVLHSGTAESTPCVGWIFMLLGVARGIKGNRTGLTFDLFTATFRFEKKTKKS